MDSTYYHNDALGSPIAATDQSGNLLWRETYRPYGERLNNAPAGATNPLWYTGKRQDPETGLVYMGARYYHPMLGRFLSIDPIEPDENNLHSLNRYAYANNNPYKFTDPDGENPFLVLLFFGLAANDAATGDGPVGGGLAKAGAKAAGGLATKGDDVTQAVAHAADRGAATAGKTLAEPIPRLGPKGVDSAHHNANVTVRDATGKIIRHERIVSGSMTASEKALGFPKGQLASHTEARAVRNNHLERGQSMTITGQNPPCPSCKSAMNRSATETGAAIRYQWRQDGKTQFWSATNQ